ncbi:MAG: TetR/AcrR family transcriptional regulator [Hespellia sp.]|nr:TetR/AcrR family transcriptional regulator [Hespellia sp.]
MEYGFLLGEAEEKQEESLRGRIVKEAWKMFREIGYEKTTMEAICKHINVTPAEMQFVFPKKENLLDTLGELFDQKYSELMVEMNPRLNQYHKLLYLNQELFDMIEKQIPPELLKFSYIQAANNEGQYLLDPQRLYYQLITQIFKEGQQEGEFKTGDSPQAMTGIYAELERGMIYNWCVSGMRLSLKENGRQLLPIYLKEFLVQENQTRLQA